jgi:hypothetical protein
MVLFMTAAALGAGAPATAPAPSLPAATQPAGMGQFMRFVGNARDGGVLQTAEAVYQKDDATVRLVAAVHIGEENYFNALAKGFEQAGVVLYEMVKPAGMEVPVRGAAPGSGIGQLQRFLKDTLNLSFQLDVIDYDKPNFVHADLDAETFQRLQAERGESFFTLMLASMLQAMSNPGRAALGADPDEPRDVLELMSRPDGERQIKLLLARQFGQLEADAMGLDTLAGTVILTERNKTVIKVLRQTLAEGKKDISIFYGAAHMPELAEKLDLMGFEPVGTTWHDAWDVRIRKNQPSAFQRLQQRMQQTP